MLFLPAQHPFCNFPLENPPSLDNVGLTNPFSEEDPWIQVQSGEQSMLHIQRGASASDNPKAFVANIKQKVLSLSC